MTKLQLKILREVCLYLQGQAGNIDEIEKWKSFAEQLEIEKEIVPDETPQVS